MKFRQSAIAVMAGTLAALFAPPVPMPPSAWANKHFVLPDGERKGELINLARTPHLIEPIDALGPDSPDNEVAVMKSAQSAYTTALQIVVGHSIDRDPCDMMVVQPTDSALTDFNSQKLARAIEQSPVLKRKVRPQTARSGTASSTYEKKFTGGALFLALATSTADLRSKTIKKAFCDEIDEYPEDLNEQGDPLEMVEARQISFLRSATWKRAYFSTPTIKGSSKIEKKYLGGDQRRWNVVCPHCSKRLVFEFGKQFIFNKTPPYQAHYIHADDDCGAVIEGWQKYDVYLTGCWIPSAVGRYKSYHFDALASPFVPWDDIARKFVEAGDDPSKLKTFWNLTLGLPYEVKGDAPDHERLMSLRDGEIVRRKIPPLGLLMTGAADVQGNGIYYEIVAIAPDRQSWVVDADFLAGDTSDPDSGAFARLTEVYERKYADSYGSERAVDAFGVDSGFRSHVVYSWVRGRPNAMALDGRDGWSRPPIGTPSQVDIDLNGRKIRHGATLWPVGTWSLKAQLYADLRKKRVREGAEVEPAGACHFGGWMDEVYFEQLTAEYLTDVAYKGRTRREWRARGPNHFLDCRIYNLALADYLGLSRMTVDDWSRLARDRAAPLAEDRSLFMPASLAIQAESAIREASALPEATPSLSENPAGQKSAWIPRHSNWLKR